MDKLNSVVFFGSGPVAAASLELLAQDFEVEAVITKPQPPHHKEVFPVLAVAEKLGLKILTTTNKKELSDLFESANLQSRLGVVIDYGIIIPRPVIDYFPLGIMNSHFSLLPRWRGADPISFAILEGDPDTGVTLMRIVEALDEGEVLSLGVYQMTGTETTPSLTDYLIKLSHGLLQHDLPRYMSGEAKLLTQREAATALNRSPEPTYSRKLTKEDSVLDFQKPAARLEREVRAFTGWPGSRTTLADRDVVITQAHVTDGSGIPGTIWQRDKQLGIHTTDGIFVIDKLKPAGKSEMTAQAFLAGYKI